RKLQASRISAMSSCPPLRLLTAFGLVLVALTSCQSKGTPKADHGALPTMERVAINANTCWFKSNDETFRPYRLAPELNSFSGRPRILAVPRNNPEARPALVVQAQGSPARLDAFGPLMDGASGQRIGRDVQRWAGGETGC